MPFSITSISKSSQNVGGTLDDGSPTKWSVNGTCVCGYGANMNWMYWIDTRKNPYANALKDHEHQLGWVPRCNKCKRGMDPKLFPPISEEFAMKLLTDIFEHDITLQESFVGEGERLHKVRITPPPPAGECGNDEIGIGDKLTCQVWVIKGLGITYEQPIQLVEPLPIASQKATANEPAIVKEIAGPEGLPTVSQYVPCGLPFPDKDGKMTLPVMGDNPLPIEIVYWEKGDGWDATNFGQVWGSGRTYKENEVIQIDPIKERVEKTMNKDGTPKMLDMWDVNEFQLRGISRSMTYRDWNDSISALIEERKSIAVSVEQIKQELAWKWIGESMMDVYKVDAITGGNGLLAVSVSDDYRVEWHNDTILVDSRKKSIMVEMPDPTIGVKTFAIKDLGGMASVNNIVISYCDKVSGFVSSSYLTKTYTLMEDYGVVFIRSDGQGWSVDGQGDWKTADRAKAGEIKSETVLMEKAKIVINGDMKVAGDLEIRNCEIVIDGGKLNVVGSASIMNSSIDGPVNLNCNTASIMNSNIIANGNGINITTNEQIEELVEERLREEAKDLTNCTIYSSSGVAFGEDRSGLRVNIGKTALDTNIYIGNDPVGYVQEIKCCIGIDGKQEIELTFLDGCDDGNADWIEGLGLAGVKVKRVAPKKNNMYELGTDGRINTVSEFNGNKAPEISEDTDWSFVFFATIGSLVGSFVSKMATDGKMNVRVAEDGLTGLDEMVSVDGSAGENSL